MNIARLALRLDADPRRVIARSFIPGGPARILAIIERVCGLPEAEASSMLAAVLLDYQGRHKDFHAILGRNFERAISVAGQPIDVSEPYRLLIGAYFSHEYSIESVALFNPSMVPHPVQTDVAPGSTRFIMSLRACGEGHISSIEFRVGTVDANCRVVVDPPTPYALTARPVDDALYDKQSFFLKLREMKAYPPLAEPVLALLGEQFTMTELKRAIERRRPPSATTQFAELQESLLWLAHSNYELQFPADSDLSERVVFPVSENESRGIEDARFVRFTFPDGRVTYYATCTAYNGFRVLPELIETSDFLRFKTLTLNGRCVQNKGMALFPRKVGGQFMMMSRLDGENIYLLRSDNLHFWNEARLIHGPKFPWEFVQVGNCGSPIETEAGWLLLTHGVGPMRQYWIGALLLDLADPSRVVGEFRDALLSPQADERDGYVPNVVYSCGSLVHGQHLIVPYAVSDSRTSVATISIPEILARVVSH